MTDKTHQPRLFGLLNQYVNQLNELRDLLGEEHSALKNRDITRLETCTKKKNSGLADLESLDKDIKELRETDSTNFSGLDDRIQSLLQECRLQNEINGAMIDISNQFSHRILEVILGGNSSEGIYDAGGRHSTALPAQTVTKI